MMGYPFGSNLFHAGRCGGLNWVSSIWAWRAPGNKYSFCKEEDMRKLVIFVIATLLMGVIGGSALAGAMSASADDDGGNLKFEYHVSFGVPLDNPDCDQTALPFTPPGMGAFNLCPDMATASESFNGIPNDQSIEMKGQGTLSISGKDGKPKKINGGGGFIHTTDLANGVSESGTWKAKRLLMFESYGPGDASLPADWRGGRALMLVRLTYDSGEKVDAILELGCRLPGAPGISGTIEGIRLVVGGGLNFNEAADPRSTLFVAITDQDDDDDDDDDDD